MRATIIEIAIVGLLPAMGCGEIQEIPVAAATTTATNTVTEGSTSTGDSTAAEGSAPSTGGTTEADVDDVDDVTTTIGEPPVGTSSGGTPDFETTSVCVMPRAEILPESILMFMLPQEVMGRGPIVTLTTGIRLRHPRVEDLIVDIVGPRESTVRLLDRPACSAANISAVFEDGAERLGNELCGRDTAISGTVVPLEPLANIATVEGEWMLVIENLSKSEVGLLENWCVSVAVQGEGQG